jgi:hypothetical protein
MLASIVRGAPLLALSGIALQTKAGERVSRLRCLLRAGVACGPVVLFHFWHPWLVLYVLFPSAVANGVIVALVWRDGGLPDVIVRTRLAPR